MYFCYAENDVSCNIIVTVAEVSSFIGPTYPRTRAQWRAKSVGLVNT